MHIYINFRTFFSNRLHVLDQSESMNEFGTVNWKLALCLLGAWTVVWLVLLKGIQSLGKVLWRSYCECSSFASIICAACDVFLLLIVIRFSAI